MLGHLWIILEGNDHLLFNPDLSLKVPFPVPPAEPGFQVGKSCWILAGWRACLFWGYNPMKSNG